MFNAIISLAEPIVAVQADAEQLLEPAGSTLLASLEAYFMSPVVLVAWAADCTFRSRGYPCSENILTDENLIWRKFEMPIEPDVPF